MEENLSMPELIAILNAKQKEDYEQRKFAAALKGVDIDKGSSTSDEWQKLKTKVLTKGKVTDPNDITSLQGYEAKKAGFGIGNGLEYEVI